MARQRNDLKHFKRFSPWKLLVMTLLLVIILAVLLTPPTEAKGMARGGLGGRIGGHRTYLKKFGTRSVVYHRKIFNTKYQHPSNAGEHGLGSDKFKRRMNNGLPNRPVTPKPPKTTAAPPVQGDGGGGV